MTHRLRAFVVVGALGFIVQMTAFALLTSAVGWPAAFATGVSVAAAVVHNFVWHDRWTWADRGRAGSVLGRFIRFGAATGLVSIAGNVVFVLGYMAILHVDAAIAAVLAVASTTIFNFVVCDGFVFGGKQ